MKDLYKNLCIKILIVESANYSAMPDFYSTININWFIAIHSEIISL